MKQLELMLTSGELNPRHQHTITLYAKGLTCEADTLGSCSFVYMAVYANPILKSITESFCSSTNSLLLMMGPISGAQEINNANKQHKYNKLNKKFHSCRDTILVFIPKTT